MSPPSAHLKSALAYLSGIRMLWQAHRDGQMADPLAIERELNRAESSIAHVLGLLVSDTPPDDDAFSRSPVIDCDEFVYARQSLDAGD